MLKKLFLRIDPPLLAATSALVKRFNWATGKDNVFLARSASVLVVLLFIMEDLSFFMIALSLIIGLAQFTMIELQIQLWENEMLTGLKNWHTTATLQSWRYDMLFCLNSLLLILALLQGSILLEPGKIIETMGIDTCLIAVPYLLSVPRPPFAKSVAWEKLRQSLKLPSPQQAQNPALLSE